jgi:hypothetical protein
MNWYEVDGGVRFDGIAYRRGWGRGGVRSEEQYPGIP